MKTYKLKTNGFWKGLALMIFYCFCMLQLSDWLNLESSLGGLDHIIIIILFIYSMELEEK